MYTIFPLLECVDAGTSLLSLIVLLESTLDFFDEGIIGLVQSNGSSVWSLQVLFSPRSCCSPFHVGKGEHDLGIFFDIAGGVLKLMGFPLDINCQFMNEPVGLAAISCERRGR
jgi:hypothetical protein